MHRVWHRCSSTSPPTACYCLLLSVTVCYCVAQVLVHIAVHEPLRIRAPTTVGLAERVGKFSIEPLLDVR